jgi:hypothetical protein
MGNMIPYQKKNFIGQIMWKKLYLFTKIYYENSSVLIDLDETVHFIVIKLYLGISIIKKTGS